MEKKTECPISIILDTTACLSGRVSARRSTQPIFRHLSIVACILGAFSLSACQPVLDYHGHVLRTSELSALKIGASTKDQVITALGKPSVVLPYDPNTVYYISQTVSNRSLLKPRSISAQGVALTFSDSGILSKIEHSGRPYPVRIVSESIALPSKHNERFLQKLLHAFDDSLDNIKINPF